MLQRGGIERKWEIVRCHPSRSRNAYRSGVTAATELFFAVYGAMEILPAMFGAAPIRPAAPAAAPAAAGGHEETLKAPHALPVSVHPRDSRSHARLDVPAEGRVPGEARFKVVGIVPGERGHRGYRAAVVRAARAPKDRWNTRSSRPWWGRKKGSGKQMHSA